MDKAETLSLTKCDWVRQYQNIWISVASGTGKTWLACALGASAVQHEMSVRYARVGRLAEEIVYARLDGTITKLRAKLARLDLLIIDDFALSPMSKQELNDIFEIIEDRSAQSSTIMIAQRFPQEWYDYITDPLLADAFMGRIRSRAHYAVCGSMCLWGNDRACELGFEERRVPRKGARYCSMHCERRLQIVIANDQILARTEPLTDEHVEVCGLPRPELRRVHIILLDLRHVIGRIFRH